MHHRVASGRRRGPQLLLWSSPEITLAEAQHSPATLSFVMVLQGQLLSEFWFQKDARMTVACDSVHEGPYDLEGRKLGFEGRRGNAV